MDADRRAKGPPERVLRTKKLDQRCRQDSLPRILSCALHAIPAIVSPDSGGTRRGPSVKPQLRRRGVFLRRLTESDLGLFAACRPKIQSKQRAININAAIAEAMLPRDARRRGEIQLFTKRFPSGPLETRLLKKTHKNWRLGGRKIEGGEFACLAPDDWFIPRYEVDDDRNVSLTWRTVSRSSDSELWGEIEQEGERRLVNGMMHLSETHPDYELLQEIAFTSPAPRHPAAPPTLPQGPAAIAASPSASPTPPMPPVVQQRPPRQKSVRERIPQPH